MLKVINWLCKQSFRTNCILKHTNCIQEHINFSSSCDNETRIIVNNDVMLFPSFINENEEKTLMDEIQKSFRRTKYEYEHWDGAIHGFRETEKSTWSVKNQQLIERMHHICFEENAVMVPSTHILDLAADGHIRPHTDSIKFVGTTIAGLSLLSNSVARFVCSENPSVYIDLLLPRYSLYIMRNNIRYNFTHEILAADESYWKDEKIPRERRVSLLLRNEP